MLRLLRHLIAIIAFPFVATVVIPFWLTQRSGVSIHIDAFTSNPLAFGGGVLLLIVGVSLFVSSLWRFGTDGEGTLAPWDPPRKLVVAGPYRYVRNPMISGVIII